MSKLHLNRPQQQWNHIILKIGVARLCVRVFLITNRKAPHNNKE